MILYCCIFGNITKYFTSKPLLPLKIPHPPPISLCSLCLLQGNTTPLRLSLPLSLSKYPFLPLWSRTLLWASMWAEVEREANGWYLARNKTLLVEFQNGLDEHGGGASLGLALFLMSPVELSCLIGTRCPVTRPCTYAQQITVGPTAAPLLSMR